MPARGSAQVLNEDAGCLCGERQVFTTEPRQGLSGTQERCLQLPYSKRPGVVQCDGCGQCQFGTRCASSMRGS